MSDALWYVQAADGEDGPCGTDTLAVMARNGGLTADTPIRGAEDSDWTPAGQRLPGLFAAAPPAAATAAVAARESGWTDRGPHPWRRYAARMFDNFVVGGLTWALIGIFAYSIAPGESDAFFKSFKGPLGQVLDGMLTLMAAIPGNAVLIGLTGTSPGKWIFGVRVLRDGRPIGVAAALRREVEIWWRGLGCGVPLVSLATLIASYGQLANTPPHVTPWDQRQGNDVTHRPETPLAAAAMILAVVALVGIGVWARLAYMNL